MTPSSSHPPEIFIHHRSSSSPHLLSTFAWGLPAEAGLPARIILLQENLAEVAGSQGVKRGFAGNDAG